MAALTKEELKGKGIALAEAYYFLEEKSDSIGKNLVTYEKVCNYANASDIVKKYKTQIGVSTLKTSSTFEFKSIREKIIAHKENFKKKQNNIDIKHKEKILDLENKISDLITKIVIYEESNNLKDKEIAFLKNNNVKIKEERDKYFTLLNEGNI